MLNYKEANDVANTTVRQYQESERQAGRSGSVLNTWCADQARAAEQIGEWELAAIWWRYAANCCLGITRMMRCLEAAKTCDQRAKQEAS